MHYSAGLLNRDRLGVAQDADVDLAAVEGQFAAIGAGEDPGLRSAALFPGNFFIGATGQIVTRARGQIIFLEDVAVELGDRCLEEQDIGEFQCLASRFVDVIGVELAFLVGLAG